MERSNLARTFAWRTEIIREQNWCMARKLRWELGLLAALLVVVCGYGGMLFYQVHLVAQESAQLALLSEAAQMLGAYRKEHGEYPASLESIAFSYPDGGDASMVENLRYVSDGKTYSLKTKSLRTGRELDAGSELKGQVVRR
jgi:hypothetical protein